MNLDQLQKIAEEAEQIKWTASEPNGRGHGWKAGPAWLGESAWSPECAANAAHIAAFDPPAAIALIAIARAANITAASLARENKQLRAAIQQTLEANGHLADGDVCTLKVLKDALAALEDKQ